MIESIITPQALLSMTQSTVTIPGRVYKIRRASGIVFIIIQHGKFLYQGVYIPEICENSLNEICEGAYATFTATPKAEKRADYGVELTVKSFTVLSLPKEEFPVTITQPTLTCNLAESLEARTLTLKHPRNMAIMSIGSHIRQAFSKCMDNMGFSPITTPKITTIKDETTNYINLRYFGNDCNLSMSPEYYLQMALSAFDRVYEISTHYSDINRNSARHLNEYTCLDFEMAYATMDTVIKSMTQLISNAIDTIKETCEHELEALNITLTTPDTIPSITFDEAMTILAKEHTACLDPTNEAKLSLYAKEKYNCELLFITHLPTLNLPFYAQKGFVLLYNGMEVGKGYENIYDYDMILKAITDKGLNSDCYIPLLDAYKYGMPPHSIGVIGIERFLSKILCLDNIREASMFPRDLHHITP